MDIKEFNSIAVRTEDNENVYFDLRPFGDRQSEAMDTYLHGSLMSIQMGVSSFGSRKIVLITDASVTISPTGRTYLAALQQNGVSVGVEGRRP